MTERPILFNDAMVRAILDGRKTQTRRVVKPQPSDASKWVAVDHFGNGEFVPVLPCHGRPHGIHAPAAISCPYGQTGDRLWVRESFMPAPLEVVPETPEPTRWDIIYAADGGQSVKLAPAGYNPTLYNHERWTPSIHMPRWASRITLEITGVRVERLRDISSADCWAEGIQHSPDVDPYHEFADLWSSVYGAESWAANPWVWVVEFRRLP